MSLYEEHLKFLIGLYHDNQSKNQQDKKRRRND